MLKPVPKRNDATRTRRNTSSSLTAAQTSRSPPTVPSPSSEAAGTGRYRWRRLAAIPSTAAAGENNRESTRPEKRPPAGPNPPPHTPPPPLPKPQAPPPPARGEKRPATAAPAGAAAAPKHI